jgi:hypothetical protein
MEWVGVWVLLSFLGLLAGCLVGIFGGGGGFFFVPILVLLFHVQTQTAVATSLAAIIPTTTCASISHFRQGNLSLGIGTVFGVGGLIGAYVSSLIPPIVLRKLFGISIIAMSIQMFFSARKRFRAHDHPMGKPMHMNGLKVAMGLFFGIFSGAIISGGSRGHHTSFVNPSLSAAFLGGQYSG